MADLGLAQSFSLIALNAQDSLHRTTVKKIALRCMAAAVVLEACLDNTLKQTGNTLTLQKDALSGSHADREAVFSPLLHGNDGGEGDFGWWLKKAATLSNRQFKIFEHVMADSLKELDLLDEIPNLLGCDLYYDSAGVDMKEYRSNLMEYERITESLRADILEDGPVTDETVSMLWLLRESGCLHDLFSENELEKVAARMEALYQGNALAKALYPIRIYHGVEFAVKKFLRMKKSAVRTQFGSGVNFVYPFLERSQSIFIDTEAWFSNAEKRLQDVKVRLESNGHIFTVLHEGETPLIKIDNIVYVAVPHAVYTKVPIQGVRLRPRRSV